MAGSRPPWTAAQGYTKNIDALKSAASHRTRLRAADEQVSLLEQTVSDFTQDGSVNELHHLPNYLHHQARMAAGRGRGQAAGADTTELGSIESALDSLARS